MTNLELASLPTTTPEERKRLLSFVVCGGGPTGVEFAAELADMMNEDVLQYFPKLLKSEMSVKVIQSRDHILNTYSEKISQFAEVGRFRVKFVALHMPLTRFSPTCNRKDSLEAISRSSPMLEYYGFPRTRCH